VIPERGIVATAVTYRVLGVTLVSAVDLAVGPGELLAVIGPNGAGKSTLLRLLSGDLHPCKGEVLVNGINTSRALPGDLALQRSVLTQREPSDIPYTVSQIVAMGRFPHRRDATNSRERDSEAVADAMAQTDTTRFANRIYSTLSKGEQTRVSLARVIAQATPIILLDEPTTALDVAHQERIMNRAVALAQHKVVVVALHDLNAAAVHADRILVMNQGTVVAEGGPREVLQADLLTSVYGQPMVVVEHPFRDCPLVLTAKKPGLTWSTDDRLPGSESFRSETARRLELGSAPMLADVTLNDQEGKPWRLSDHLDTAAMLVFLRGDW
jgi:iron complex transport system ATP-binding protein